MGPVRRLEKLGGFVWKDIEDPKERLNQTYNHLITNVERELCQLHDIVGDDVAMGGVSVGASWWQGKSAVVHRVNPVEGEEWVLVIDWVAVQE